VGRLLYGAEKHGRANRIRIRDKNIFHSILARMKKWFSDIS
jgi:cell division protein FtsA